MGTLYDQLPRQDRLYGYAVTVGKIGRDIFHDGRDGELTEAQWHVACDVARTALAIQNADVRDEQLAGFGKLLEDLTYTIADAIPAKTD